MTRLKNITSSSVALQLFDTTLPVVGGSAQEITLNLKPGEDVDESLWLVSNETDPSYNASIINNYIKRNILTRI
jgi:hypothetical protein